MVTADDLKRRITFINWLLPTVLAIIAVAYQLVAVSWMADSDHTVLRIVASGIIYIFLFPLAVFGILKLTRNWLEQQEQERTQKKSEQDRLALIINTTPLPILTVDSAGRIENWNHGVELLFDYDGKTIRGRPLYALLGAGTSAEIETRWLFQTVQREGVVRRHETIAYDNAGHRIHIELTVALLDRSDKLSGMSIIMRDITSNKLREEETRRLTTRLNKQANERASELTEKVEQLAQANTELRQLDQTRSEFVSLVSHQIRAPLTNMAGAVQRMQINCTAVNATCNRMFSVFEEQVARLDRLVQDVLNATRIEAGEILLNPEPISITPVVHHTIEQIAVRTPARAIHLADKPGLPLVYADRDRVIEVLTNLLDNADKYSPPDTPILVEVRADQNEVTVAVRDFGGGLPDNDTERVFEKFYRADSSDSQRVYGYGLGLYVCRCLMQIQNGRIWAENHPDGGSVFMFSLPAWEDRHG